MLHKQYATLQWVWQDITAMIDDQELETMQVEHFDVAGLPLDHTVKSAEELLH